MEIKGEHGNILLAMTPEGLDRVHPQHVHSRKSLVVDRADPRERRKAHNNSQPKEYHCIETHPHLVQMAEIENFAYRGPRVGEISLSPRRLSPCA